MRPERSITATSGVPGYGMPLGTEEAQVESSLWLWGAGGDWAQGDKLVANQPKAVEAFAQMKKLIDAKTVQADPGATPAEIEAALVGTAYRFADGAAYATVGGRTTSPDKGAGLVDVVAAVAALR